MSVRRIAKTCGGDVSTSKDAGTNGPPKAECLIGGVLKDVEAAEHHGHLVAFIIRKSGYPANSRCLVKEIEMMVRVFVDLKQFFISHLEDSQ